MPCLENEENRNLDERLSCGLTCVNRYDFPEDKPALVSCPLKALLSKFAFEGSKHCQLIDKDGGGGMEGE